MKMIGMTEFIMYWEVFHDLCCKHDFSFLLFTFSYLHEVENLLHFSGKKDRCSLFSISQKVYYVHRKTFKLHIDILFSAQGYRTIRLVEIMSVKLVRMCL